MSIWAVDEDDDRVETCCESFPLAKGELAAGVIAGEMILGETEDFVTDVETTWGDGGTGEGVGAGLEDGVVLSLLDFVTFTFVETTDLGSSEALGRAGASGGGFKLGGDVVVVAGTGGAVEQDPDEGRAGTTEEAEDSWDCTGGAVFKGEGSLRGTEAVAKGLLAVVQLRGAFGASLLQSISSALVVLETLLVVLIGGVADGTVSSLLTPSFAKPGVPAAGTPCLAFCPSPIVSGAVEESFRGRPRLRFGESVRFPSSAGEVGWEGGVTICFTSANLGGVFGGRPLFLFTGTRELTLDSEEATAPSLPGAVSTLRAWLPPLPLPTASCCSPSWAAIRDSVSSLRRTGRFLSTGMSGERCGGE